MSTVLQDQEAAIQADLYMSFELGDKKWQLTLSDGRRGPSRYSVDAGEAVAVVREGLASAGTGLKLNISFPGADPALATRNSHPAMVRKADNGAGRWHQTEPSTNRRQYSFVAWNGFCND